MRVPLTLAAFLAALAFPHSVSHAATGGDLLTLCEDNRYGVAAENCARYVGATIDLYLAVQDGWRTTVPDDWRACMPGHQTIARQSEIVLDYLRDNPSHREEAVFLLVTHALNEAYDCWEN